MKERAKNQTEEIHSQWTKRWSTDSSSSSHIVHFKHDLHRNLALENHPSKETNFHRSFRLSNWLRLEVRTINPSILWHGLLIEKVPLESRDQTILSSPSGWTSTSKTPGKGSKLRMLFSSQSFELLVKVIFQWYYPPFEDKTSCIVASLKHAILKTFGNWTLKRHFPHHLSS